MGGITYGAPLKLAVSYGGGLFVRIQYGPGYLRTWRREIGWVRWCARQRRRGHELRAMAAPGIMVTGNVLRTFAAPLNATSRRTYVGASLHVWPAFALGGELGYFVRLGDGANDARAGKRVVSWSVGFGF